MDLFENLPKELKVEIVEKIGEVGVSMLALTSKRLLSLPLLRSRRLATKKLLMACVKRRDWHLYREILPWLVVKDKYFLSRILVALFEGYPFHAFVYENYFIESRVPSYYSLTNIHKVGDRRGADLLRYWCQPSAEFAFGLGLQGKISLVPRSFELILIASEATPSVGVEKLRSSIDEFIRHIKTKESLLDDDVDVDEVIDGTFFGAFASGNAETTSLFEIHNIYFNPDRMDLLRFALSVIKMGNASILNAVMESAADSGSPRNGELESNIERIVPIIDSGNVDLLEESLTWVYRGDYNYIYGYAWDQIPMREVLESYVRIIGPVTLNDALAGALRRGSTPAIQYFLNRIEFKSHVILSFETVPETRAAYNNWNRFLPKVVEVREVYYLKDALLNLLDRSYVTFLYDRFRVRVEDHPEMEHLVNQAFVQAVGKEYFDVAKDLLRDFPMILPDIQACIQSQIKEYDFDIYWRADVSSSDPEAFLDFMFSNELKGRIILIPLGEFPVELLVEISKHLKVPWLKAPMTLVCKRWYNGLTESLFKANYLSMFPPLSKRAVRRKRALSYKARFFEKVSTFNLLNSGVLSKGARRLALRRFEDRTDEFFRNEVYLKGQNLFLNISSEVVEPHIFWPLDSTFPHLRRLVLSGALQYSNTEESLAVSDFLDQFIGGNLSKGRASLAFLCYMYSEEYLTALQQRGPVVIPTEHKFPKDDSFSVAKEYLLDKRQQFLFYNRHMANKTLYFNHNIYQKLLDQGLVFSSKCDRYHSFKFSKAFVSVA